MKRLMALAFLGLILTAVVAACGASKGHCEAYDGSTSAHHVELPDAPE